VITVPAYRFAVSEALRHKRRALSERKPGMCWPLRAWALGDTCFHACYLDLYGVLSLNSLVMGEDHLLNTLSAFILARQGKSVLVIDDGVNSDPRVTQRFEMHFPGMDEIVCAALGISRTSNESLTEQLVRYCREFLNSDGECLVHQLEHATLVHDQSTRLHSFWAEPACAPIFKLGMETLRFWPRAKLDIFGTEIGKCHQYRAEFESIILTSASQYSRLNDNQIPLVTVGDAKTPLELFEFYRASDRLREILDVIKVLCHGQDVSTANQHHA
jgi:hypothetical protein